MVESSSNPHDALFKRVFSVVENAGSELRAVLPRAVVERIDWSTLQPCPGSFVDEALVSCHSDLLYSVQLSGKAAFVYVLFEHQSSVDPVMPVRLLGYVASVLGQHILQKAPPVLPLPMVVAVVLHHSETGWTKARSVEELFDPELLRDPEVAGLLPRMGFVLDDISGLTDEELFQRALELVPRVALWALRDARSPTRLLESLPRVAPLLVELLAAPDGLEAMTAIFRYILWVSQLSVPELTSAIRNAVPQAEEAAMTTAEQLIAQGEAKGEARGRAELLLRLMTAKFGPLPEGLRLRVVAGSTAELEGWADRFVTAASLGQVFQE